MAKMIISFVDIDVSNREQLTKVYNMLSPYFEKYNIGAMGKSCKVMTGKDSEDDLFVKDLCGRTETMLQKAVDYPNRFFILKIHDELCAVILEINDTFNVTFKVLRGSRFRLSTQKTLYKNAPKLAAIRDTLIKDGSISKDGVLLKDVNSIKTLSSAVSLIKGYNVSTSSSGVSIVSDISEQKTLIGLLESRILGAENNLR